ncbi:MAG: iron ABC transporter permease [Bacteroidia bacterium]|nr:iron ABC transporter permease [Bacteroidia bacterium]
MRNIKILLFLFVLLLLLFILDILTGSVFIPVRAFFPTLLGTEGITEEWRTILLDFRLPKAITAIIAGLALSVSGLLMQTLFRNPLAGPDVLGVSSGASLGVALLVLGYSSVFGIEHLTIPGNWAIAISSSIGAGMILLLIMAVSLRVRDIMTVLILGIMFGAASLALTGILQFYSSESSLRSYVFWTMGSLSSITKVQLYILAPGILAGIILAFLSSKMLNVLLLGEEYAKTVGLNIRFARICVFAATSILAGFVTAFCGPIGFIGIAAPHITRFILKTTDHKILLTGCILVGPVIMLVSDIISQLPGDGETLPVSSITALLGIPVIIWIIIKNQRTSLNI